VLEQQVQELLDKDALDIVRDRLSPGFYSRTFVVLKRHETGGRPEILNQFLQEGGSIWRLLTPSTPVRHMDLQSRPERCILSRPHPPQLKKVSQGGVLRPHPAMQGLTLRVKFGSMAVHANRQRGEVHGAPGRISPPSVPGNLA